MTEASEQTKLEAREEVTDTVRNGQVQKARGRGIVLVALGLAVGVAFFAVLWFRSATTSRSDTALCEKIDRFIVISEAATISDPNRSAAEKKQALKLFENFRNDPPVCRTTP